jgi:transcriptional regulator with XRE-family HTH domain
LDKDLDSIGEDEIALFYSKTSANVKKYRLEKGLSQMDLGLAIGIKSVAFFSNCESNRYSKHFNIEHIYRISKVLDKDVCVFFK